MLSINLVMYRFLCVERSPGHGAIACVRMRGAFPVPHICARGPPTRPIMVLVVDIMSEREWNSTSVHPSVGRKNIYFCQRNCRFYGDLWCRCIGHIFTTGECRYTCRLTTVVSIHTRWFHTHEYVRMWRTHIKQRQTQAQTQAQRQTQAQTQYKHRNRERPTPIIFLSNIIFTVWLETVCNNRSVMATGALLFKRFMT